MTSIRTSLPVPTQPWEAARNRFLDGLGPDEVQKFQDATLENIFYDTSVAQKRHARGSTSWMLQERLSSLVDGIAEYGNALDVYANTSALIMCPIWGSIRIVLHVISEAGKFQDKLVDMLAQIGDVLPRFRIYQDLFRDHERILVALSAAYLDVMHFCVRTKEFFASARKSFIPLSVILRGAWKPFRQEFDNDLASFRKHRKNVEKEADLAHMIESAKIRDIEFARHALQLRNEKLKRRHHILSNLPAVDYQASHSRLSSLRYPGTNVWLQNNTRFTSWRTSSGSDCLPLYGIPGSGKSVLAASVANDLSASLQKDESLCYYYCDYAQPASLDVRRLVASLIKQIIGRMSLEEFDDKTCYPYTEENQSPTLGETVSCLLRLVGGFKIIFIVFDGMDELDSDGQRVILGVVERLLGLSSTTMKIFTTSRAEEYLVKRTLRQYESISLSTNGIQDDILAYIEGEIDTLIQSNPLLENERIRRKVCKALSNGAQGMFLWVRFQLYAIGQAFTEHDLRTTIDNLPRNLGDTYMRIIEKLHRDGGAQRIELMKKIFHWIAYAQRPLRIDELEEAIGIEKTDLCLHSERIIRNTGERLVSACGNLVTYNSESRTVMFAHHTVQRFLSSRQPRGQGSPFWLVWVNPKTANEEIGELCITYLCFSDFETQIAHIPKPIPVQRSAVECMVWGSVPFGSQMRGLVSRTRSRKEPSAVESRLQINFVPPISTRHDDAFKKTYALLEYAIEFWAFHSSELTDTSTRWSDFIELVFQRQIMFEFRPWRDEQHLARVTSVLEEISHKNAPKYRILSAKPRLFDDEDQEVIAIHAWAVSHDIRSLLSISNQEKLLHYFQKRYPHRLDQSDQAWCLKTLCTTPLVHDMNLWSGEFIYDFLLLGRDYMQIGLRAKDRHFDGLYDAWLDTLACELRAWPRPNGSSEGRLFDNAIVQHFDQDLDLVIQLLNFHVKSTEHLSKLVVEVVNSGKTRIKSMEQLLFHQVSGRNSGKTTFELAFALNLILKDIYFIISTHEYSLPMQPDIEWLLILLSLGSQDCFAIAHILITEHVPPPPIPPSLMISDGIYPITDRKFKLPDYDWTHATLGSQDTYETLIRYDGLDVLGIAFLETRKIWKDGQPSTIYLDTLIMLVSRCSKFLDPKLYETCGILCLDWAVQWAEDRLIQLLITPYGEFVRNGGPQSETLVERFLCGETAMDKVLMQLQGRSWK